MDSTFLTHALKGSQYEPEKEPREDQDRGPDAHYYRDFLLALNFLTTINPGDIDIVELYGGQHGVSRVAVRRKLKTGDQ